MEIKDTPINLLETYKATEGILMKEFNQFISTRTLVHENPKFDLKTNDVILFKNGYDLEMISKILGFNEDGNAYVLWDCHWFAIKLEDRLIKKLDKKDFQ